MGDPTHPAAENIHHLGQAISLIGLLDDEAFTREPDGPFRGGVGSQFRHCLDFYGCFLAGLPAGRVDYTARERDPRLERDRDRVVGRIREITVALRELGPELLDREIHVRSEPSPAGDEQTGWCRSTVLRELQFLASHTVHHHALILSLLAPQGFVMTPELAEFGVAPSTATHWETAGQSAGAAQPFDA